MKILLVEDDETLCQTIPFQLRQEGFTVDVAVNGEDGLQFARAQLHDLILLDRMLPGLDGMEILRIMRWEHIQTPVLFLTALGQRGRPAPGQTAAPRFDTAGQDAAGAGWDGHPDDLAPGEC